MCASARNDIIPTPPHPTPQETSYGVASTMCASARNVVIPTPPQPHPLQRPKSAFHTTADYKPGSIYNYSRGPLCI